MDLRTTCANFLGSLRWVFTHLFSSAGPATSLFESLASLIGAGLVVGGFAGGMRGLLSRRSRSVSEEGAVTGGYAGGAFGLVLLLIDTVVKSFV